MVQVISDKMKVVLSQNIKYFKTYTFNRKTVITTEWEKTPHVHTKIKRHLKIKTSKAYSQDTVNLLRESSLFYSGFFSTQPDKQGILPHSYLKINIDLQVRKC